jgi:uncharacterized protein (TIGR02217 family)
LTISVFNDSAILDLDVNFGTSGGPTFSTDIVTYANGAESRNINWALSRYIANLKYEIKSRADAKYLYNFFLARMGRGQGFRVKDLFDFSSSSDHVSTPVFTDQVIGTGNGVTTQFQLKKLYTDSSVTYSRNIYKPMTSPAISVGKNGVLQTLTTHYTVNYNTGIVTFVSAPANGLSITAGFKFHVPVRFDIDSIEGLQYIFTSSTNQANDIISLPDITIIETREIA